MPTKTTKTMTIEQLRKDINGWFSDRFAEGKTDRLFRIPLWSDYDEWTIERANGRWLRAYSFNNFWDLVAFVSREMTI